MRTTKRLTILCLTALLTVPGSPAQVGSGAGSAPGQTVMTLEEFLSQDNRIWFLTGRKAYSAQAMMASGKVSFRNELEAADYIVTDDGFTVILKGNGGEMWTSALQNVLSSYTLPDGSALSKDSFAGKDVFIDILSIPTSDSHFAMHVPVPVSVRVETSGGNILYANQPDAPHGNGDFLVCRADVEGKPDLSDVWVLNGILFPERYDNSRMISAADFG